MFTMKADGTDVQRITNASDSPLDPLIYHQGPAWSPDGTKIAYSYRFDLYLSDIDGSNVRQLTTDGGGNRAPSWSADGTSIAFESYRDGNSEIYVISSGGSLLSRLTTNQDNDRHPKWSPQSFQIAFSSYRDGVWNIYSMDLSGNSQTLLTDQFEVEYEFSDDYWEWEPSWSPDGSHIAFSSDREGKRDLFVVDAGGSNIQRIAQEQQLPNNWNGGFSPAWKPD